jgi:hypothetical protein
MILLTIVIYLPFDAYYHGIVFLPIKNKEEEHGYIQGYGIENSEGYHIDPSTGNDYACRCCSITRRFLENIPCI